MKKIIRQSQKNFDLMASHFDRTRTIEKGSYDWFISYLKPGMRILDLGCGNGRLYGFLKKRLKSFDYLGVDFSSGLLEICRQRYPQANFLNGDLSKNSTYKRLKDYDVIFLLRVLPHFPTPQIQLKVLQNVARVLKKEGFLFIELWNLWQLRFWPRHFTQLPKKILNGLCFKWIFVPYKISSTGVVVQRFHYSFTLKELVGLVKKAGFEVLKSGYKDKGENFLTAENLFIIAKK